MVDSLVQRLIDARVVATPAHAHAQEVANMQVGMVGLGKMGMNLVANLRDHDIEVVAFDLNDQARTEVGKYQVKAVASLDALVMSLASPRIIWSMVPAGKPTAATIQQLAKLLSPGDVVIDGGNSYYQDSIAHGKLLAAEGIHFFDVGTSGGMAGARANGNFMIGGDEEQFAQIEPLFKAIAAPGGYLYTGPVGSGHYLKMVHNGIEYGMMQAIGEGFDVLAHSPYAYDNAAVAKMWNHGSVIRSWLMELAGDAFSEDADLAKIQGIMHSSGEGAWTVEEALRLHVATPVIASALMMRYRSEEADTMTGKVVAALRNQFGGHAVDPTTQRH
ncbi:phosphogluconate dehydrogenase (NAD(+)-dependent, decarboxylating) [Lacticaseibacillus rhamnosus]|uniref:phosphogluconate dehydrogenase (NAD(+)-dependent, decarboxylating) n=1 Tax=Lacticaseibacillus rhamnosus TaxID=47715 RepID=UPI000D38F904|nr:decarboxylating 6-phosphogluconate dehydrogenase [Lacticaseibacillus rhamnosus]MDZ5417968.1 decarboxylating 6-phosphogluconate dehydrogenase [Lacticaseibacillus rhamnosus]PTR97310.1 6-phosphogluconate dehydrogenase (decarboxylating) [Lacticaseibacillus rhamnosus]PTS01565.1 6-phosphogluconate dehydrogenase (decarboxylating) [Lacticaseibacillus rhamnosus]UTZ99829.1 decarboxylating 6-phosphogluconate dehydrogenase [Lacticaseibacillus rhamnosus]UUY21393.1 decarboxylating 6-phosphogluconate dehy